MSISELDTGLRTQAFTCSDIVRGSLAAIEAEERRGPSLNALITINPEALDTARSIDRYLPEGADASGTRARPVRCVPVVIKDNIETDDLPTTEGSRLFAGWVPARDATVVAKLRRSGAIVVAKANLDDFAASSYGISSLAGPIHNPYALALTVSGSSGGSATAVAAGYVPLALGTDAGGSLRIPASFTSVVAIRPTLGLVSRAGIMPRGLTQDTPGPIARTVADAAFGLDMIAGYDADDPATAASIDRIPREGYAAHAQPGKLRGARIGVVQGGLSLFGGEDPGVSDLLRRAVSDLRSAGATVIPVAAPRGRMLGMSSVLTFESRRDVDRYLAGLVADCQRRSSTKTCPPVSNFRQLYDSGAYTRYAGESFRREIQLNPETLDRNAAYKSALQARLRLQRYTLRLMREKRLDAIVYASTTRFPQCIGMEQGGVFTRWSENTGYPAITVPMGFAVSGAPPRGYRMPAGLEWLGPPYSEPRLIELAASYEALTHRREAPVR